MGQPVGMELAQRSPDLACHLSQPGQIAGHALAAHARGEVRPRRADDIGAGAVAPGVEDRDEVRVSELLDPLEVDLEPAHERRVARRGAVDRLDHHGLAAR